MQRAIRQNEGDCDGRRVWEPLLLPGTPPVDCVGPPHPRPVPRPAPRPPPPRGSSFVRKQSQSNKFKSHIRIIKAAGRARSAATPPLSLPRVSRVTGSEKGPGIAEGAVLAATDGRAD